MLSWTNRAPTEGRREAQNREFVAMRMRFFALAVVFGAMALAAVPLVFSDTPPANIGQKVSDFTLKDTQGRAVALGSLKDAKALVVLFVGTECPINNNYVPRLK